MHGWLSCNMGLGVRDMQGILKEYAHGDIFFPPGTSDFILSPHTGPFFLTGYLDSTSVGVILYFPVILLVSILLK